MTEQHEAPVEDQRDYWNRRAAVWEERAPFDATDVDPYGDAGIDRLALRPGEVVADIGCGVGATVLRLAPLVQPGGRVLGVDVSDEMIAASRRRIAALGADVVGADSIELFRSDVVDGALDDVAGSIDALFSRFGVMFFPDPPAAFSRLVSLLRPGGRLSFVVWAPFEENSWMSLPARAAAEVLDVVVEPPALGRPGPFSLSDHDGAVALAEGAGLVDVVAERFAAPRRVPDERARLEIESLLAMGPTGDGWAAADDATRDAAVAAVVEAMGPYRSTTGWDLQGTVFLLRGTRPT